MPESWKTVILGGGPAGLAAGLGCGGDTVILEQAATAGGLSSSFEIEGAIFDRGGHSFHTPHSEVQSLISQSLEMVDQVRIARCYSHGSLIGYPFQKFYYELDSPSVVDDCRRGLENASLMTDVSSFDRYLPAKFGEGIAEHFLVPYNEKLWGKPLSRMGSYWVQERVAGAAQAAGDGDRPDGNRQPLHDRSLVSYPARGGFGEIAMALARRVPHLRFDSRVVTIDAAAKELTTEDGNKIRWERLIATLPIDQLLDKLQGVPSVLSLRAKSLECVPLALIMVVIDHPVDTDIQRIYCADSASPAHKIVLNHNSSNYLRALPRHGIMGEVSLASGIASSADLESEFVASLLKLKLIASTDEIVCVSTIYQKYGYPVPTLDCTEIMSDIKDWLRRLEIYTLGRFGEWAYINADEAIYRGLKLGRELAGGITSA